MDLDDLVEDVFSKKTRKKLKKQLKKQSLLQLILAWIAGFFMGRQQGEDTDRRDERRRDDRQYRRDDRRRDDEKYRPKERRVEKRRSQQPSDPLLDALAQAQQYRMNIEAMALAAEADSVERLRLDMLSERVTDWTLMIEEIVDRALTQQEDPLLAEERKRVPEAIARLERQLEKVEDPTLRHKLERTLDNRRRQLAQLQQMQTNRQMAELKVENALAQLGIIYSQLHSGQHVAERNGYERLSAEINDEIYALEDYLDAYQDLQQNEM